jgi:hypothetical protein
MAHVPSSSRPLPLGRCSQIPSRHASTQAEGAHSSREGMLRQVHTGARTPVPPCCSLLGPSHPLPSLSTRGMPPGLLLPPAGARCSPPTPALPSYSTPSLPLPPPLSRWRQPPLCPSQPRGRPSSGRPSSLVTSYTKSKGPYTMLPSPSTQLLKPSPKPKKSQKKRRSSARHGVGRPRRWCAPLNPTPPPLAGGACCTPRSKRARSKRARSLRHKSTAARPARTLEAPPPASLAQQGPPPPTPQTQGRTHPRGFSPRRPDAVQRTAQHDRGPLPWRPAQCTPSWGPTPERALRWAGSPSTSLHGPRRARPPPMLACG